MHRAPASFWLGFRVFVFQRLIITFLSLEAGTKPGEIPPREELSCCPGSLWESKRQSWAFERDAPHNSSGCGGSLRPGAPEALTQVGHSADVGSALPTRESLPALSGPQGCRVAGGGAPDIGDLFCCICLGDSYAAEIPQSTTFPSVVLRMDNSAFEMH